MFSQSRKKTDTITGTKVSDVESSKALNPENVTDVEQYEAKASREMSVDELWNKIGFHKSLAGFYFNLLFMLIDVVVGILFAGPFVSLLFPYPESQGYRSIATGLFSLVFAFIDFWFGGCWDQFIPPRRMLGVKYMMRYVQFFTWVGVFTGLIKLTIIVFYGLFIAPETSVSYTGLLLMMMILINTPQPWSAMGTLAGTLQHYNKTTVYGFITGQVFVRGVRYLFIFLGRIYGSMDTRIGELLGLAIGEMIGQFLAHAGANFLGIFYYRKTLNKEGITLRDFFGHDITWPEIKEMLVFGIKRNGLGLINQVPTYSTFLINLSYIGQITTLSYLAGNADTFANYVNQAPGIGANVISEAYMNGKKNLTQYYIRQVLRYSVFFQCFLIPLILMVNLVLPTVISALKLSGYALLPAFVIPAIIAHIPQPYAGLAGSVIAGTNHPLYSSIMGIFGSWLGFFFNLLWIVWLQLPATYGISAMIWVLPAGQIGTMLITMTINFIFIHKKIVPIKVSKWQTFGAPLVGGLIMLVFDLALANFVMFPLIKVITLIPAAFITLFVAIEGFLIYFGITALIGGWDDDMLKEFEKAARMSGPSKFMVLPLFKFTQLCARVSNLHGRFSISSVESIREGLELYAEKKKHK